MEFIDNLIGLGAYLPWVGLLMAVLVAVVLLVKATLALLDMRRLLNQKTVFLEIIPPVLSDKTPHATQQFYSSLHGLGAAQHWRDKLLRRKVTLSLELPSKKEDGIRFVARVPESELTTFKQKVRSYSKDVRFQEVADYLPESLDYHGARVLDFGQTGHFALPLSIEEESLEQSDPIPYITGAMAQPVPGELIAYQLVISPTRAVGATTIAHKVLKDPAVLERLTSGGGSIGRRLLRAINTLLFGILGLEVFIFICWSSHNVFSLDNVN